MSPRRISTLGAVTVAGMILVAFIAAVMVGW